MASKFRQKSREDSRPSPRDSHLDLPVTKLIAYTPPLTTLARCAKTAGEHWSDAGHTGPERPLQGTRDEDLEAKEGWI